MGNKTGWLPLHAGIAGGACYDGLLWIPVVFMVMTAIMMFGAKRYEYAVLSLNIWVVIGEYYIGESFYD